MSLVKTENWKRITDVFHVTSYYHDAANKVNEQSSVKRKQGLVTLAEKIALDPKCL